MGFDAGYVVSILSHNNVDGRNTRKHNSFVNKLIHSISTIRLKLAHNILYEHMRRQ